MSTPIRAETERLVTAVAATGLHGAGMRLPDELLPAPVWLDLVGRVQFHRVEGLFAAAVHGGALAADVDQRAEAAAVHADAMKVCVRLESDLVATGRVLEEAGVPFRVLKGPATAHLDYGDPALRTFGDIDLLVTSRSYDDAAVALAAHGYARKYREVRRGFDRRFGKGACFVAPNRRETDLHRTFVMGPFGLTIDLDRLWDESAPFEVGGRPFDALGADHRFLHVCYHAAIGNTTPHLSPLRDLAGMLQRPTPHPIDVDRVRRLAAEWRAQAVVARAIRLAWDRFALPPTELSSWAADYRATAAERRALAVYLDRGMGYAARSFAALAVVPGARDKARFAWALAFPDRQYGAGRHGGRLQRWKAAGRQIARLRHPGPAG